jgi:uncharacterized protein YlaI
MKYVFSILIIATLYGCITKTPNREPIDKTQVFNANDFLAYHPTKTFIQISIDELNHVVADSIELFVRLFALWCPYSFHGLKSGEYVKENSRYENKRTIYIHSNFNLKGWNKIPTHYIPDTVFFLDESWGVTERDKVLELQKFLCDSCESRFAVPQVFKINWTDSD